jgi:hypothetical protein
MRFDLWLYDTHEHISSQLSCSVATTLFQDETSHPLNLLCIN